MSASIKIETTKTGKTIVRVKSGIFTIIGFPIETQSGLYINHFSSVQISPKNFYDILSPVIIAADDILQSKGTPERVNDTFIDAIAFRSNKSNKNPQNSVVRWRILNRPITEKLGVIPAGAENSEYEFPIGYLGVGSLTVKANDTTLDESTYKVNTSTNTIKLTLNRPKEDIEIKAIYPEQFAGLNGLVAVFTDRNGERIPYVEIKYGTIHMNAGFVKRIRVAPVDENGKADPKQVQWMPIIKTTEDAEALITEMVLTRAVNEKLRSKSTTYAEETATTDCPF